MTNYSFLSLSLPLGEGGGSHFYGDSVLNLAINLFATSNADMNWIFSVNSDGLSPLDVAVLSNNRPLAKMLVAFGAQEGNQCK